MTRETHTLTVSAPDSGVACRVPIGRIAPCVPNRSLLLELPVSTTYKTSKIAPLFTAFALACAGAAHAESLLDGATYASLVGTNAATVDGVSFSASGGNFATKFVNGWGGLGVSGGASGNEIDVGQSITMSFAAQVISDFSVALLYNGPEFGDYREMAKVAVYNGDSLLGTYALTAGVDGSSPGAAWTGFGSVSNLSAPTSGGGAAWLVSGNPFGNLEATKLVFTAMTSNLCQSAGSCNNQSDYVISTVHAVPEPETYALFAAGLGAIVFVVRRRRRN